MSINRGDMNDGGSESASRLLARRAADDVRATRRFTAVIADVRLDPADRMTERELAMLRQTVEKLCALIENDVRQFAARQLVARGLPEIALTLTPPLAQGPGVSFAALAEAGCLAEPNFLRAMLQRVGTLLLAEDLPATAPAGGDQPSLLARLSTDRDGVIADAATALLAADARRRDAVDGAAARGDLAAEDQHRLVWWVTAAVRRGLAPADDQDRLAFDHALTEAAARALAVHDEGERTEAAAAKLVHVLSPAPLDRATLMVEALADQRVTLFIALLADALGVGYDMAAALVLEGAPERFWLALRAAGLDRAALAQIGFALAEAGRHGPAEQLADQIDTIMSFNEDAARAAIGGALLHPDLDAALRALGGGR